MSMKSSKIIAIILVLVMLLGMLCTVSYAGFIDGVLGESGSAPAPPTPPDAPPTTIPSTPSTPSEPSGDATPAIPVETITCYTSISGNVYEDLGYISIGTSGADDERSSKAIEGITVRLKQNGKVVQTTKTDENGNYSFHPAAGTYSVDFVYGDLTGVDMNNKSLVQNALKYNGQDYFVASVPGGFETGESGGYMDSQTIEIQQSGKGCLQLYIALDCSYSMRSTMVEYNGKTQSRLAVVVDSAKQLCSSLINSGDNIYVGLIFFSGTNYRAVSLTKNLDLLNQALDDINSNGWYTANTNIVGALDKGYISFANNGEDSNRYITILSDGVPTSDGNTQTYYQDSEDEVYRKLDIISQSTIDKLEELKSNGVNIISLITKSEDEEENRYVQNIFKHSTVFENIEDGYKTVDIIKEELKDYIISHTGEKHYSSSSQVLAGYEDSARRQEVDSNFDRMNYDNTIDFEQINNYDSVEKAQELSEKTWINVEGGQNYSITSVPSPSRIEVTEKDPETGEQKVVKIIQYVETGYTNQNLVLARRPGFALATKITATGLRFILQNGQTINTQTREPGSDFPIVGTLDKELSYGTTVQIEYTISIKNDSSMQCNYLELMNYLPEKFTYDPEIALITADGKNGDYGWEAVSLEDLRNENLITQETVDKFDKNIALRITLDNAGKGEDGFYIAPGGEYEIKYVVSRIIGSLDDIENPDFGIASEVLTYQDQANRRMLYTVGASAEQQYLGVYPGDSKDMDYSDKSTNEVIIIPPTGDEKFTTKISEILTTSLLTPIIEKIIF